MTLPLPLRAAALAAAAATLLTLPVAPPGPAPAFGCADGCSGVCRDLAADWRLTASSETALCDRRAVEDAGLFVGHKTRDLLASIACRTAAVELFTAGPGGTLEAALADLFVASFRRHVDYMENETVAVSLALDPVSPLHLLPADEARAKTGADLLVTCKYAGASVRGTEFRPDSAEVRMRRLRREGIARFRVMASALSGSDAARAPLFIDEVAGGFIIDTIRHTGTDGVELLDSAFRVYDHYPGIQTPAPLPGELDYLPPPPAPASATPAPEPGHEGHAHD